MAIEVAAPLGRFGSRRRMTRLKPSTMTAKNIARSRGVMMSTIHLAAIPARITAMMTRALRDVAEGAVPPDTMAFLPARGVQWPRAAT